jgi:hypothetical protein
MGNVSAYKEQGIREAIEAAAQGNRHHSRPLVADFVAKVVWRRPPNRDSVALARLFARSSDDGAAQSGPGNRFGRNLLCAVLRSDRVHHPTT